ncbi:MAG: glycoside hydrolase family 2 protein [Kiritimatiellaeota bacterium]|nr:glycoside hydrolase family 2 protein [Kiritimatiellota bacterium]
MKKLALALCVGVAGALPVCAEQVVDLAGIWSVQQVEGKAAAIEMRVPGDVHTALLKAGRIPDPYFGRNEEKVQWVGEAEWVVSRDFEVPAELLAKQEIILRLEHVDTFCTVEINGQKVGETGNRFRRYDFDVKEFLKPGRNTVTGTFWSAEKMGAALKAQQPFPIPTLAHKDIQFVRKPTCNGGWDWGISLMSAGFAGPVKLIGYDAARIDYVYCEQKHGENSCTVDVFVEARMVAEGTQTLNVQIGEVQVTQAFEVVEGDNLFAVSLTVDNPKLWWPNGEGAQHLYGMKVTLGDATFERKLGLRTIEVVNKPDEGDKSDRPGMCMTFRVNGADIFCKGANWIPCDAMLAGQTPERYRDLLTSARDANMNMIRLWGGGQFEADEFYEICDELGLMVWHDFMFSCSLYPSDKAFLAEVQAELAHQIRRLRDHAAIALWCGDNECIGALKWFEESRKNRDLYLINYDRLSRVLAEAVKAYDPTRMFWPSSPCGGPGDFSDAWHNDSRGDMHNWNVWHENKDFAEFYKFRPRFCSEFGFQSFSSPDVVKTFCPPEHRNPTAPDFEHHQKNDGGNARIMETMARYFRFPDTFEDMLYLSQVQQAIAIKTAVEGWRRLQPRCMGTLYWQLNDNWPVASWSSVEYGGKWKHLHYHARRFYAPAAVVTIPVEDGGKTNHEIWVVNDYAHDIKADIALDTWTFGGRKVATRKLTKEVAARSAIKVETVKSEDFGTPEERMDRFVALELKATGNNMIDTHRNAFFFNAFKKCELADAAVTATPAEKNGRFEVTLQTDKPAFFVWCNVADTPGEFSDNSLTLLPGQPVTLTFTPKVKMSLDEFRKNLTVTHLRKTYR